MAKQVEPGDGNGWVIHADGTRRWGRFGAAGLLLRAPDPADPRVPLVLLQHRAKWTASGDTWALAGGARDSHEDAPAAALRETEEEAGIDPDAVRVRGAVVTSTMAGSTWSRRVPPGVDVGALVRELAADQSRDAAVELPPLEREPGGEVEWSYTTVVADAPTPLETEANNESLELRWVPETEVAGMPLMPAFAAAWPGLRAEPVALVVDMANVLGSRANGWWRDRAGFTVRLLDDLAGQLPRTLVLPGDRFGWIVSAHAVVEGQAKRVEHDGPLDIHRAKGEGDDEIVAVAHRLAAGDDTVVVVTADRGLRDRLAPGIVAVGPSTILGWR